MSKRLLYLVVFLLLCIGNDINAQVFEHAVTSPSGNPTPDRKIQGIAIDSERNLYVADETSMAVHRYDRNGVAIETIRIIQTNAGMQTLKKPTHICIDAHDNLYIYDASLGGIIRKPLDGQGLFFGEKGSALGQIDEVRAIVADSRGYCYVLNGSEKRVDVYSPDGIYLTWIAGTNTPFDDPIALGINKANELYVLEKSGATVYVFDPSGRLVNTNRSLSSRKEVSITRPIAMSVLPNGDFFILDFITGKSTMFNRIGVIMGNVGMKGNAAIGVFGDPALVSCASAGMTVGVFDRLTQQVQIYNVKSTSPAMVADPKRYKFSAIHSTRPAVAALAVAPNGNRYAIHANDNKKVVAYKDTTDRDVFAVIGKLDDVVDVATDTASNIYVVDRGTDEVLMFDDKGIFIRRFGKEITDKLKDPVSVVVQKTGDIVVADRSRGSLYMWSSSGIFKKVITSSENSVIRTPIKIECDSKDQLYVWDEDANCIYRTGSGGWPTAEKKISVRPVKPGDRAGVIGDFFVDPLDLIHVYNKTTSQIEVYSWDFEPVMVYSIGRPGNSTFAFSEIEHMVVDKENLRVYLSMKKGAVKKAFQFMVPPPVPDSKVTYDVENGDLQLYFNKVKSPAIIAHGLLEKSGDNENVVYSSTNSVISIKSNDDDIELHRFGFVSQSWSDHSEPSFYFDDYFSYGKSMLKAQRYHEALGSWELAMDKMGSSARMSEYIAKELASKCDEMINRGEIQDAIDCIAFAHRLLPSDKSILARYGTVHRAYYEYLLQHGESAMLLDNVRLHMANPALKNLILHSADTVSSILGLEESLSSINTAITIKKKLIESDNNAEYHASLAATYFQLYKFKKLRDVTAPEMESIIREILKYGQSGYTGLKQAKFNYFDVHLIVLEALNAQGKFDEVQRQAGTELGGASSQMNKATQIAYRRQLAFSYAGQMKYVEAESEFKTMTSLDPSDRNIQSEFAELLTDAKKYEVAKGILQQLLVNANEPAPFIARIGKLELLDGHYAEATFQLEKAIELDPTSRINYGYLAEAYRMSGNTLKAMDNYEVVLEYLDKTLNNVNRNNLSAADINELKLMREKYLLAIARIHEENKDAEAALANFRRLTEVNPGNAAAWFGAGNACVSTGRIYDAISDYDKALALEPSNKTYSSSYTNSIQLREDALKHQSALAIVNVNLNDIYPSLYKNYPDVRQLPIGEIIVANNTSEVIMPTSVSVSVPEFMTQPSPVNAINIQPYSNERIKLSAIFPESILKNTDKKTTNITITVNYLRNGEPQELTKTSTVNINGRNAITWADKRFLAAFVSPQDQKVISFAKEIDSYFRTSPSYGMNRNVLKVMQVFTVLGESGISYSSDPNTSYSKVSLHGDILDFLQYPAETMQRKGGDCDDLTTLLSTVLENSGVTTAYVDIPGHVMVAFDSGLKPNQVKENGFEPRDVVVIGERVWIPVETTLLGSKNFMIAWKSGAERFYKELDAGNFPELIPMSDAWKFYQPSSYTPESYTPKVNDDQKMINTYDALVSQLVLKTRQQSLNEMSGRYVSEPGNTYVKNAYATLLAQTGRLSEAERILIESLAHDPEDASVLNNLGNVSFLIGNYRAAVSYYEQAAQFDAEDADILINLCRANLAAGNKAAAATWFNKAVSLNSELGDLYINLKTQLK